MPLSDEYYSTHLYSVLTKDFPAPWKLHYHKMEAHYPRPQVSSIEDSNGGCPLDIETYTGDGDHFSLGSEGAEALVVFVNGIHINMEESHEL